MRTPTNENGSGFPLPFAIYFPPLLNGSGSNSSRPVGPVGAGGFGGACVPNSPAVPLPATGGTATGGFGSAAAGGITGIFGGALIGGITGTVGPSTAGGITGI